MPRPQLPYWLVSTPTHGPHWIAAPDSIDALARYATWAITATTHPPNLPVSICPYTRNRQQLTDYVKTKRALTTAQAQRTI